MGTTKILLNETIYKSRVQAMENRDKVTKYLTWGIFEYSMKNNERVISHMLSTEDSTKEISLSSLTPEQNNALTEKGYWQCIHDGR